MDPSGGSAQGVSSEEDLLGEALGFLAKECGWDKDFVAEKFTVQQIIRYAEIIQGQKITDLQLHAIAMVYAVGAGMGTIKFEEFHRFLNSLKGKKEDVKKTLDRAKEAGVIVEDN